MNNRTLQGQANDASVKAHIYGISTAGVCVLESAPGVRSLLFTFSPDRSGAVGLSA